MQQSLPLNDPPSISPEVLLERLYRNLTGKAPPAIQIEFYPYVNVKNTIRLQDGLVRVRLSDVLVEAPEEVLEGILSILLHKLLRRRLPDGLNEEYRRYILSPPVQDRARKNRARRGRKRLRPPDGQVFDLKVLFESINQEYFQGELSVRKLGWGLTRAKSRLGHFDPAHQAIVLNPRLDHPLVPQYVVEFVLYHEMLHLALGDRVRDARRKFHHREFRQAEQRFRDYQRATRFIEEELC